MQPSARKLFRLRSFVRRDSRLTAAQERAQAALSPTFGIEVTDQPFDFKTLFGREAKTFLEIGFGSGLSLLAVAKLQPENNFIGVETHKPGIGALYLGIQADELTNIRVCYADVIDVLEKSIPNNSLDGVQIFFPDPWPKRRHHARRLIQPAFLKLVVSKLKQGGVLHLATDWEDYATHMLTVVTQEKTLKNLAGEGQFAARSSQRPVVTKFEQRAEKEGRLIRELQLEKI
jgi:tRNA (guanine-N7-)-methyltransferase